MSNYEWVAWLIGALGVLVGAVGATYGILTYRRTSKKNTLSWNVVSDQALINSERMNFFDQDIKVTVGNTELSYPRAITVRLVNSGTVGLETNTMHLPLRLTVLSGIIHSAEVTLWTHVQEGVSEPADFSISTNNTEVSLGSVLLNAGSEILFRVLIDGREGEVLIMGGALDFTIRKIESNSDNTVKIIRQVYAATAAGVSLVAAALVVITVFFSAR